MHSEVRIGADRGADTAAGAEPATLTPVAVTTENQQARTASPAAPAGGGRSCGPCRVCCKTPDIPELGKGLDTWCPHITASRTSHAGCTVYGKPERPAVCAEFKCGWLAGLGAEDDRPDRLGVLMQPTVRQGREGRPDQRVMAFVEYRPGALASARAQRIMEVWAAHTGGSVIIRKASAPTFIHVPVTVNRVAVTSNILDRLGKLPTSL